MCSTCFANENMPKIPSASHKLYQKHILYASVVHLVRGGISLLQRVWVMVGWFGTPDGIYVYDVVYAIVLGICRVSAKPDKINAMQIHMCVWSLSVPSAGIRYCLRVRRWSIVGEL